MPEKRVLVVDDEQPILDLLRDSLSGEGFEVHTALTAADALELIREHLFDAVILDFALPDMNGVMLHHKIREMDEELAERTLFISGVSEASDSMAYFSSDAAGFLAKPFNVWEVAARIRKLTTPDS